MQWFVIHVSWQQVDKGRFDRCIVFYQSWPTRCHCWPQRQRKVDNRQNPESSIQPYIRRGSGRWPADELIPNIRSSSSYGWLDSRPHSLSSFHTGEHWPRSLSLRLRHWYDHPVSEVGWCFWFYIEVWRRFRHHTSPSSNGISGTPQWSKHFKGHIW